MKLNLHLIFLCLFFGFNSFSQHVTNYGPFVKIANSTVNLNYLTDDYILLEKYKHSDTYNGARKKDDNYHILNTDSNSGFISKKVNDSYNGISGDVFEVFLTNEYIVEFISFVKPLTYKTGIGAVKRNRATLETVGEIKILDEQISFSLSGPNANIQQTKDGYVYTRIVQDNYIVSYLDNDFDELKKIILQDDVYKVQSTQQKTMNILPFSPLIVTPIQVNEHDELIFTKISEAERGGRLTFHFTIVSPNGNVIDINPKIEQSHSIRNFHVNYLSHEEAIECFFQYGDAPKMKGFDIIERGDEGYFYYKMNLEGEILESSSRSFSIEDVYADFKDQLLKKYDEKKLGDDIMSNISYSRIFSTNEGYYLLIDGLTWNPELRKSVFILKTDKKGNYIWSRMLGNSMLNHLENFALTSDNQLSILLQDFSSAFSNNSYQPDILKKQNSKAGTSLFKIVLDKTTGEFIENDLVDLNIPADAKIQQVCKTKDTSKYLIESSQGKSSYFSVIEFK